VSDYDHPEFPPIRAARNSLQAMRALLADPALSGWPPGRVTVIENPASAADLAESTTGVLPLGLCGEVPAFRCTGGQPGRALGRPRRPG